jgi:hypothetical protein
MTKDKYKLKHHYNSNQYWEPTGIYYLQSKDYVDLDLAQTDYLGQSIGKLMFENYEHLLMLFKTAVSRSLGLSSIKQQKMKLHDFIRASERLIRATDKSELHKHLEFYLKSGETTVPKKRKKRSCRICGQEANFFAFIKRNLHDFKPNPDLIFCDRNTICERKIKSEVHHYNYGDIISKMFKFSNFSLEEIEAGRMTDEDYIIYQKSLKKLFTKVFYLPENISDKKAFNFFVPRLSTQRAKPILFEILVIFCYYGWA